MVFVMPQSYVFNSSEHRDVFVRVQTRLRTYIKWSTAGDGVRQQTTSYSNLRSTASQIARLRCEIQAMHLFSDHVQ
jgi:hypothetical protein